MIQKIRWLWKQFNGPFITAFAVGIYRLFYSLNYNLSYLNRISIATAGEKHLTLLGLLRGLTRTTIKNTSEVYAFFTKNPEHNNETQGVSDGPNPPGGIFIDLNDPQYSADYILTPGEMFRRELQQANVDMDAANGSLIQICNLLNWNGKTDWRIDWHSHGDYNDTRTWGDLHIQALNDCWGTTTVAYRDALEGTIRNIVGPMTMVDIELVDHF